MAKIKIRQPLEVGYWVALSLKEGSAPLRCYIGEVRAINEVGVRLTLADFLVGKMCHFDFFAPWSIILAALVATEEDDHELWIKSASNWQVQMNGTKTEDK